MNYFGPWLGQMSQFLTIEDMVTFNNIQHTNYKMGHVLELWNKMDFALFFFYFNQAYLLTYPKTVTL